MKVMFEMGNFYKKVLNLKEILWFLNFEPSNFTNLKRKENC